MAEETDEGEGNDAGDVIRAGASLASSLLALFGQKVQIIIIIIKILSAINLLISRLDLSRTFWAIRCCMLYIHFLY